MKKEQFLLVLLLVLFGFSPWTKAQESLNPLSLIAEYNLKADGTFASGDPMAANGDYFASKNFASLQVPQGYHIPSMEELMIITGKYSSEGLYPVCGSKFDKEGDEVVCINGETLTLNSHYKSVSTSDNICYALRFKGASDKYYSAYRWENIFDGNNMIAQKITSRLLGSNSSVIIDDITNEDFWNSNNTDDVVRYLPTMGYIDNGTVENLNRTGYYASSSVDETNEVVWHINFDDWWSVISISFPYDWQTPVRLIKGGNSDPVNPDEPTQDSFNPLSQVAEFNLNNDGTFATGDPKTALGGYFSYTDYNTTIIPEGYHIPSMQELMVLLGQYNNNLGLYPDYGSVMDKEGEEEVCINGEVLKLQSHYKSIDDSDNLCYALRFKGADDKYYSAYRWEVILNGNKIIALKITSRLLGSGSAVTIDDITTESYWNANNENDVVRYLPAAGYSDGDSMSDVNNAGWYGCNTENNTSIWCTYFDDWWAMTKNNMPKSWKGSLRLYSDKNASSVDPNNPVDPDEPSDPDNPKGADIVLGFNNPNANIDIVIEGPETIEVDFGDGDKTTVNLVNTQGVVAGNVVGSEIYIYSKDIKTVKANNSFLDKFYVYNGENISYLNLGFNTLTELVLKNMPNLEYLNAVKNDLETIDLQSCPKLTYVSLADNRNIKELDLSNNPMLIELHVGKNDLNSLDLSNLPELEVLTCGSNQSLSSLDLSKLPYLRVLGVNKSSLFQINIEKNTNLMRLDVSDSYDLNSIVYNDLSSILCIEAFGCNLDVPTLNQIIKDLPDVNSIEVRPENRNWLRQFEYDNNPDCMNANAQDAKAKGWYLDVLKDSWSVGPDKPCLILTTGLDKGESIKFTVENLFDPFWVFWGKFWGSYYQVKKYTIKHDVVTPDIEYYSRGLMTFECIAMILEELDFTGNDQTYYIDVRDNEIKSITLDPNNVMVGMNLSNNKLSGEELDKMFTSLNNLSDMVNPFYFDFKELDYYGVIDITGNPGCKNCDASIAEKKGYTILGAEKSGIHEIEDTKSIVRIDENSCIIANTILDGVVVYNIDGTQAFKSDNRSRMYETNLSEGLYVIGYKTVGSSAYKYVKVNKK